LRIQAILRGGLGNQLFQFAFLRNLQIEVDGKFELNTQLGFASDFRYFNKFQMNGLLKTNISPSFNRSLELAILEKISVRLSDKLVHDYLYNQKCLYLPDPQVSYEAPFIPSGFDSIFAHGYWQSPFYFKQNESLVVNEIHQWMKVNSKRFLFQDKSRRTLVGIGMRTYSETKNPAFYARGGLIVELTRWQAAIDEVIERLENIQFMIFTRDQKDLSFIKLDFRGFPVIIHDDTGKNSLDSMVDFALCDHHVFNNSTFYWWGAYLHKSFIPDSEQIVLTSDNFLNEDAIPVEWSRF
jgi:hypothetical protein